MPEAGLIFGLTVRPICALSIAGALQILGRRAMFRMRAILIVCALTLAIFQQPASARVKSLKEMREAGVIIQQWDTSCAAAALATVLTYVLRHPISERAVAQGMLKRTDPLKVKHRGGFSLLDMKRFVETQGFEARAMQGFAMDDLVFFDGAIVPINQFGYNHYVIFRGINADNTVHLADPAFGNRTLNQDRCFRVRTH